MFKWLPGKSNEKWEWINKELASHFWNVPTSNGSMIHPRVFWSVERKLGVKRILPFFCQAWSTQRMRNMNSTLGHSCTDVPRTLIFPCHESHTISGAFISLHIQKLSWSPGKLLLARFTHVQLTSWQERRAFSLCVVLAIKKVQPLLLRHK